MRVFHGQVNVLGCILANDNNWHQVISDPRKNMLIDIKNDSKESEVADFRVVMDDQIKVSIGDLPDKVSVIAIKEFKKYSEAEDQFLIPSDSIMHIRNLSTVVESKKSFFNLNQSWKDSISSVVNAVSENTIILVNGVVNSGKSTFASCLINQLLSKT